MPAMKNAPLIEIVAEVRWADGISTRPPSFVFGADESLYVRLGILLGKNGYDRLERVQPEGVPSQPGTVVYRYRRADEVQNTLYQAGVGVFTANGLPPYNAWDEFHPVVRQGIEALWESKAFENGNIPVELTLRYLDAFTPDHLGEMTQTQFIDEIVGIKYQAADVISKMAHGTQLESLRFNAVHSAPSGEKLVLEVGQGVKDGQAVLVVNTVAFSQEFLPESPDAMLANLDRLQELLHELFFEMLGRSPSFRARLLGANE